MIPCGGEEPGGGAAPGARDQDRSQYGWKRRRRGAPVTGGLEDVVGEYCTVLYTGLRCTVRLRPLCSHMPPDLSWVRVAARESRWPVPGPSSVRLGFRGDAPRVRRKAIFLWLAVSRTALKTSDLPRSTPRGRSRLSGVERTAGCRLLQFVCCSCCRACGLPRRVVSQVAAPCAASVVVLAACRAVSCRRSLCRGSLLAGVCAL